MDEKEIRFIDLFAGVGGFHKGLEQANNYFSQSTQGKSEEGRNRNVKEQGTLFHNRQHTSFSCVWANEWDKHPASIYKKRFPKTPFFAGDIRQVADNSIPKADLLCAGFPCQPFSLAGKRKGFEEARGTLFYEICRIAKAKRFPYLLLENVKGLLSAQEGDAFRVILDSLDELGYVLQWQVLNSKDFGVPQNRERVFVVGCLGEKRFRQVFPLGENGGISYKEGQGEREGRQGIQNQISSTIGKGYGTVRAGGETMIELTQSENQSHRVYSPNGISKTISSSAGGVGAKTGIYAIRYPLKFIKRNQKNIEGDYAFTVDSVNTGGIKVDSKIRRLTPVECERLQGFPDGWTKGLSDTQRYKCMGNAVTVNVVEAIGRAFLEKVV